MTAPRARIKFVRGRWEKIEPKAEPLPPLADRLFAALHNINARLVVVEHALASMTAPAVKPTRSRKPSQKSVAASD
jgi:hypothetical protein